MSHAESCALNTESHLSSFAQGGNPFFFKPIQDGMERPKTELSYKIPSRRLTRNAIKETYSQEEFRQGLDTTIDWTNGSALRLVMKPNTFCALFMGDEVDVHVTWILLLLCVDGSSGWVIPLTLKTGSI